MRITITLLLILAIAALTGCAAIRTEAAGDSVPDATYQTKRLATKGAHLGWVFARAVYENPVNRPVLHASTLSSYALKSTGGLLRRIAIGTVQMPSLSGEIPDVGFAEPMDMDAFEKKLDWITGTRRDTGRIDFLVDGHEYFQRLESAIANARESIDIRTYIFDNDDIGVSVADQLKERSDSVRVRVMLDSLGNLMAMQTDSETMPADHDAPLSMRMYLERNSSVKVRNVTNPWTTGDHTKTTIVDKKLAFVGGMNIGREYRHDWHDLMMEVTGPVVDKLQYESDKAWARASLLGDLANFFAFVRGTRERTGESGYPVRVLQTRNFDSDIYKAQIAAIQSSRSYILIENAYFSDDRIIYELARARRRGVDVRVIIPSKSNSAALNASNEITVNTLLQHGIRVYEYPGMSHVKAAIYDGWACAGSANFDKLSLKVNKELNIATSDPGTVQALLDEVFIPDLLASKEIRELNDVTMAHRFAEIMVDELL